MKRKWPLRKRTSFTVESEEKFTKEEGLSTTHCKQETTKWKCRQDQFLLLVGCKMRGAGARNKDKCSAPCLKTRIIDPMILCITKWARHLVKRDRSTWLLYVPDFQLNRILSETRSKTKWGHSRSNTRLTGKRPKVSRYNPFDDKFLTRLRKLHHPFWPSGSFTLWLFVIPYICAVFSFFFFNRHGNDNHMLYRTKWRATTTMGALIFYELESFLVVAPAAVASSVVVNPYRHDTKAVIVRWWFYIPTSRLLDRKPLGE